MTLAREVFVKILTNRCLYTETNTSLANEETIIYQGRYLATNPYIEFETQHVGRYMRLTVFNNSKKWKDNYAGRTSLTQIIVGERVMQSTVLPSTNSQLKYSGVWTNTTDGYYYNGVAKVGVAGNTLEYEIPAKFKEFGIIGDMWEGMGTASVYLDGQLIHKVNKTLINSRDIQRLKLAHRSFRQLLYYSHLKDEVKHTVRLVIESGEIYINGVIVDCTGDQCNPSTDEEKNNENDNNNFDENKTKGLSKTGTIAITVVVVIVVIAGVIALFIVGMRKEWWYKKVEDSDPVINDFAI